MSQKNSRIVLSKNIKLDKTYKQVLSYNESNMIGLLTAQENTVYYANDYSFIRDRGSIKVNASYSTCIQANYMAFQNFDWNGKWFFAFIDKINYLSDNATEIYYTIDEWSTWFDYWNPKQCFIIRQHATTDVAGDNTIPEDIEHGEYISNGAEQIYYGFGDYWYVVVTSGGLFSGDNFPVCSIGGLPGTGFYYVTDSIIGLRALYGQTDETRGVNIIQCYIVPKNLIPSSAIHEISNSFGVFIGDLSLGFASPERIDWTAISSRPSALNGVTPVNQKLLTYPYQYAWWTNSNGASNILKYELSTNTNNGIIISFWGVPTLGGSIIAFPLNYDSQVLNLEQSLMGGKFPTLGWSEDAYTNWLTQNGVNPTLSVAIQGARTIGGLAMMAMGGASLGALGSGLVSGLIGAGNAVSSIYDHKMESDSYKGNINGGDILSALGANTFVCVPKCIKAEYVRKIDKYFTRYGYRQNAVQYPNMTHRQNYNYIQIAKEDNIGYPNNHNNICLPASSMELINSIARSGVTVWNNHANFGDYSVTNNITN